MSYRSARKRTRTFTLRSIFGATTLFAAILGHQADRAHRQANAVRDIRNAGGEVDYAIDRGDQRGARSLWFNWLRSVVGIDYLRSPEIVTFYSDGVGPDDKAMEAIGRLRSVRCLLLSSGGTMTAQGFAMLARLPNLEVLSLRRPPLASDFGAALRHHAALRQLFIEDADSLTEDDLFVIAGLQQLRKLTLDSEGLTDLHLDRVSQLRNVQTLHLSGNRFTDDGLRLIAGMRQLRVLTIISRNTDITDSTAAALSRLSDLEELTLSAPNVGDGGVAFLAVLKRLRYIDLGRTRVSRRGLAYLGRCSQLEYIGLLQTSVTIEAIRELRPLRMLMGVGLQGTAITDDDVNALGRDFRGVTFDIR